MYPVVGLTDMLLRHLRGVSVFLKVNWPVPTVPELKVDLEKVKRARGI